MDYTSVQKLVGTKRRMRGAPLHPLLEITTRNKGLKQQKFLEAGSSNINITVCACSFVRSVSHTDFISLPV